MMQILYLTDAYLDGLKLDSFRQGILNALVALGHDVSCVVPNRFITPCTAQPLPDKSLKDFLDVTSAKRWDLVLTLNRAGALPQLSCMSDTTPIITWYIDSPARLSSQLKKHKRNEHVFMPDETYLPRLAQEEGLDASRVHYLPFATTKEFIDAASIPSDAHPAFAAEVSFVGSLFSMRSLLDIFGRLNRETIGQLLDVIKLHQADYHRPLTEILKDSDLDLPRTLGIGSSSGWSEYILRSIDDFLSSRVRIDYLEAVCHRDLKIYGNREWLYSAIVSLDLLSRCMLHEVGAEDLRAIYRSSKVLLNICHVQARSALPFRVFDILGCGGFLLSEYRDDLARLFRVGEEVEMFRNKEELSSKLDRYLADDEMRETIAARGRKNVMKHHLISHRVEEMLSFLGSHRP